MVATLLVIVGIYLLPLLVYAVSPNSRPFIKTQVLFKPLVDSITANAPADSAKAMLLYNYVANTCRKPGPGQNPKYNQAYEVLQNKTASCDQQVWLLMGLLRVADIDAEMVFLYGNDSISRHTVAQVDINKEYIILDPFYNLYFKSELNRNAFAAISELEQRPGIFNQYPTLPDGYAGLYSKKYSYKIHSTNKLHSTAKLYRRLVWFNMTVFGSLFSRLIISL